MATETQTASAPELTIIQRVTSIPLVKDSLAAVDSSLANNPYTRSPYSTAQAISASAFQYSQPLAARLAPLLVRADGLANQGLDAVETRYPYPFKTPTDDIIKDVRQRSDEAVGVANKTIDERIRSPAYSVAQGIDQRFAPIVDYFAVAVSRIHQSTGHSAPNGSEGANGNGNAAEPAKYQYQRALALSIDLKDQLYEYSNDQLKQLQSQSALVQRATETAQTISNLASSSLTAAQTKAHSLSDTMISELQSLQSSTAALPAHLQSSFKPIQDGISSTITEMRGVLTSDLPLNEKVGKLGVTVQEKAKPVLENARIRVQEVIRVVVERGKEEKGKAQEKVDEHANGITDSSK